MPHRGRSVHVQSVSADAARRSRSRCNFRDNGAGVAGVISPAAEHATLSGPTTSVGGRMQDQETVDHPCHVRQARGLLPRLP